MKNAHLKGIALAAMTAGSAQAYADCGEVTVGSMGWASGEALAAITSFVLEQGYGCEVTLVPTDTVPAVTSLVENGQPDIIPEIWINGAPAYAGLEAEGKVVSASKTFSNGGEEGWWIPTYLAEKHPELTTIEGILANPELVDNRFHNCPVGWGCRIINDNLKAVYGIEEAGIEYFDHGSGANLSASIASAFEDGDAWFGYYWGPTAVLGKYEMTKVDLGPVDEAQHRINADAESDPATHGKSDFPASPVFNAVTADLVDREPEVAAFMGNMELSNALVSKMLAWKDENNASAEETAAWFMVSYKDQLLDMVNDEARAKLASLL